MYPGIMTHRQDWVVEDIKSQKLACKESWQIWLPDHTEHMLHSHSLQYCGLPSYEPLFHRNCNQNHLKFIWISVKILSVYTFRSKCSIQNYSRTNNQNCILPSEVPFSWPQNCKIHICTWLGAQTLGVLWYSSAC